MTHVRFPGLMAAALAVTLLVGGCGQDTSTVSSSTQEEEKVVPTVFWLDVTENAVYRATGPDFDDARRIVTDTDISPDGIAVDVEKGLLYWTSMGLSWTEGYDLTHEGGTLQRASLDGSGVRRIVERGITEVPKQMQLDTEHGHIYWADREGATIWRAQLDGTRPEPLVTGHGNIELVGIALDIEKGHVYFSDKTTKKIFRTAMALPQGQTSANRTDIELLIEFPDAAMPVDLAVDLRRRHLYWTDRFHGTVNRAGLDVPARETPRDRSDVEVVVSRINEPVGLSLDLENEKLYYGTLGGRVGEAGLDGSDERRIAGSGSVTGVTVVHLAN